MGKVNVNQYYLGNTQQNRRSKEFNVIRKNFDD